MAWRRWLKQGRPPLSSRAARYVTRRSSTPPTALAWPWCSPECATSGTNESHDVSPMSADLEDTFVFDPCESVVNLEFNTSPASRRDSQVLALNICRYAQLPPGFRVK